MSSVQSTSPESVASQRDAFVERFLGFASGTFSLFSIYIGDRLGLYQHLAQSGASTAAELADRLADPTSRLGALSLDHRVRADPHHVEIDVTHRSGREHRRERLDPPVVDRVGPLVPAPEQPQLA